MYLIEEDEDILTEINRNNININTEDITSRFYDETFESDTSSKLINQSKKKLSSKRSPATSLETSRHYSDTFENDTESLNKSHSKLYNESFESLTETRTKTILTSELSTSTSSSSYSSESSKQNDLQELRRVDLVKYVREKLRYEALKAEKELEKKQVKTNKKQIKKLIDLVKVNTNKDEEVKSDPDRDKFKINPQIINKLKTENSIVQIRKEQLEKIENFGNDQRPLFYTDKKLAQQMEQKVYFLTKYNQINKRLTDDRYELHQAKYASSVLLIGEIAGSLPKFSDPPELVWDRLMQPNLK